ncbi:hypothetical protein GBA52_020260, partial [Prunus armeniaca]
MGINVLEKPLGRPLVLTDQAKVGVIFGTMAESYQFVDFSYSLVATLLSIQDHIAGSRSKRGSGRRQKVEVVLLGIYGRGEHMIDSGIDFSSQWRSHSQTWSGPGPPKF